MKHLPCLIASALLTCAGVGIAQAGAHCETFIGTLTLEPNPLNPGNPLEFCDDFQQIKRVERMFEDAVFVFELDPRPPVSLAYCFKGTISNASLIGPNGKPRPVEATSFSALTVNAFDPNGTVPSSHLAQLFTAASVVTISSAAEPGKKAKELGSIFLRDMGVNFLTPVPPPDGPVLVPYSSSEQLIGVGGTREFARASVSLQIEGNEFAGANVFGTVCR